MPKLIRDIEEITLVVCTNCEVIAEAGSGVFRRSKKVSKENKSQCAKCVQQVVNKNLHHYYPEEYFQCKSCSNWQKNNGRNGKPKKDCHYCGVKL